MPLPARGFDRREFPALAWIRTRILSLALTAVAAATPHDPAQAQSARQDLFVTDGSVYAAIISGNTLYIGGNFRQVGLATGGGVPIDSSTGAAVGGFPKVTGSVFAAVPDGAGGLYIGGSFSHVGGLPRNNLAHILADNTVSTWNPNADRPVHALAASGSTIYVGGEFYFVGGQQRPQLAALDAVSGLATAWNPGGSGTIPQAIVAFGGKVYAGGFQFLSVGGRPRIGLAQIDSATGLATSWDPYVNGSVYSLKASGTTLYVGGSFDSVAGKPRSGIAALDVTCGDVLPWAPNANGQVFDIAVDGAVVYAGGQFTSIGGQPRNNIAALDASTGAATSWDPNAVGGGAYVRVLAVSGTTVYAGGFFSQIGGQPRYRLSALNSSTGLATSWNPDPHGAWTGTVIVCLKVNGTSVYAGGSFDFLGGQPRTNAAAFDLTTGLPTAWNPNASGAVVNGQVQALAMHGSNVIAGGYFTNIGGQPRNRLAELDGSSGLATAWDPSADNAVLALSVSADTVFAGGVFTHVGSTPQVRNHIAAIDASTAIPTAWNPNANQNVLALQNAGGLVYAGGDFTSIGGQTRNRIAALNGLGLATTWNPNADGQVATITVSGFVYVGGSFGLIGALQRHRIAAIDVSTGLATAWNPNVQFSTERVNALTVSGSVVYAGGLYTYIGGQTRANLAALDVATGLATTWKAEANNTVRALTSDAMMVYAGGDFTTVGLFPQAYLCAITQSTAAAAVPEALAPDRIDLEIGPNPVGKSFHIRYALPDQAVVTVTIQDIAGRLIGMPVRSELQTAGIHYVEFDAGGMRPGMYICHLQVGGAHMSTKVVLVR